MRTKDALIKFMWKKQELLKRAGAPLNYFTEIDAEAIKGWDASGAEVILSLLKVGEDDTGMCPFCIARSVQHPFSSCDDCDACEYGAKHGICTQHGSDYKMLTKWAKEKFDACSLGKVLIDHKNELNAILKEGVQSERKRNTN